MKNHLQTSRHIICSVALAALLTACDGAEQRQEKYMQRAQEFFQQENYEKAEVEVKNVLQINPKSTEARFLLARIHRENSEFRQAFANFKAAADEDPNFAEAHVEVAKIYFAAEQNDLAREHIAKAMASQPHNKDGRVLSAALYARTENYAKAVEIAEGVLADFPGESGATAVLSPIYAKEDPQKALALIDRGLQLDTTSIILKQLKIDILSSLGRAAEVENVFIELINEHPQQLRFFYRLARGYAFQNRLDEAESTLRLAIANNPDNVDPKYKLVEFTVQRRGFEAAEATIREFIEKQPELYELQDVLAQLYLSADRAEAAKAVYQGIISAYEGEANALRARNSLAKIHLVQNNRAEAERLLQEVFAAEPANTDGLTVQARIKLADNDIKGAIADLRAALKTDNESIEALKLLALAHEREGSPSLALDNYRRIISLDSSDMVALIGAGRLSLGLNQIKQAEEFLELALGYEPANERAITLKTRILVNAKQWDKAHELTDRLLAVESSKPRGLLLKAGLYRTQDQWDQARELYRQSLEFTPKAFESVGGYVDTFLIEKDFDGAIDFLEAHLKTHPQLIFARDILATVYARKGDSDTAIRLYQQLIEKAPERESAYQKLAAVYAGKNDYAKAEAIYLQGLKHNPDFSGLRVFLANHYQLQENYSASKQHYEKALQAQPDLDIAKNNLAVLLVNHFPSEANYQRALELASTLSDNQRPVYMNTLGWVHYHLGNLPQAISYLEAAVNRQEDSQEFRYHLGMAYLKNGDADRARRELQLATQDSSVSYFGVEEARKTLELM